jgi:heme/copper-type cytochrome/quinol oxidase subunit 2
MFILSLAVMIGVSVYVYQCRKLIDEMHGMMVGMTFGVIAGLFTATLYLIPTGNFLVGVIAGSFVGLIFGVPFGKLGGHLGIMEGVMAGPMGGMMGAMLGQMIRPFNIEVFMPFFTFIFVITMVGISYAVHCGVSCCGGKQKKTAPCSSKFKIAWAVASVVLMVASLSLSFSIQDASASPAGQTSDIRLPAYLQQATQETRAEAVQKDGRQEIDLTIANSAYSPNVLVVKRGIPLRINVRAEETAGCGSEIVIPDFNIRKIVGAGTSGVIELTPNAAGTFKFHCSMDMARGKIIVQ